MSLTGVIVCTTASARTAWVCVAIAKIQQPCTLQKHIGFICRMTVQLCDVRAQHGRYADGASFAFDEAREAYLLLALGQYRGQLGFRILLALGLEQRRLGFLVGLLWWC